MNQQLAARQREEADVQSRQQLAGGHPPFHLGTSGEHQGELAEAAAGAAAAGAAGFLVATRTTHKQPMCPSLTAAACSISSELV